MDELLVIDKIIDFIVPVKLRGKHMGVLMERGVKLLFLGVVTVIAAEGILRKTIEAIGDRSAREILEHINYKYHPDAIAKMLKPLLSMGYLGLTIPDKPNSPKQKYRKK